jgi:hypothetical protein
MAYTLSEKIFQAHLMDRPAPDTWTLRLSVDFVSFETFQGASGCQAVLFHLKHSGTPASGCQSILFHLKHSRALPGVRRFCFI